MKNILNKIFTLLSLIILIFFIVISIAFGIITINASNAFLPLKNGFERIKIYDNKNELLNTSDIAYTYQSINNISPHIINAFISIEDRDYYKHNGININRIAKAIISNVVNNTSLGASTITQQYVKNVYLSNEKTIKRKINEIALAIEIEKRYTKDQILEAYLNSILFGANIYGIGMASYYYFDKDPSNVSISMAAYLAGMIQAPNYYNAYNNPIVATKRKNIVLKAMLKEGYISESEYEIEKLIKLEDILSNKNRINDSKYYSSYIDYVYDSIYNLENIPDEIYTYLDTNIQKDLFNLVSKSYGLFNDDNLNCAIVVLDNKSYGIKALIGNRNTNKMVINYATNVKLQPGSTIKPILDYAPAIEYLGYTPATIITDEIYSYQTGEIINNYDHKYLGPITLRKALSDSRNVPAVKLFNEVGHDRAFEFANKLGLYSNEYYEADAIGGAKEGYTLLDLANAYQAFANLGYFKKANSIKEYKINGNSFKDNKNIEVVMKPSTAFLINSILHDVYKNTSYDLNDTYLMAKTGQTNYDKATQEKYNIPSSATKDSLLIAYTKDLTMGIWIGYSTITNNTYLDWYKKTIPRNIMKYIFEKYAKKNQYYEMPKDVIKCLIEIKDDTVYLAKENGYYEYFLEGTEPIYYYEDKKIAS